MFGRSYFGGTMFGPSYFGGGIPSIIVPGGPGARRKRQIDHDEDDIKALLQAFLPIISGDQ